MSGLEPLVVISLTCNIIELIKFGCEVASTCITISKTGFSDPDLIKKKSLLETGFSNLKHSLESQPKTLDQDERELLSISKQAISVAQELNAEIDKVSAGLTNKSNKISIIQMALKRKSREGKIRQLEKRLEDCRRMLDTGLLVRIS